MADIINLQAEDNRDIVDDDAVPTLRLDNTNAAGTGLKLEASGGGTVLDLNASGGIGIDLDGTTGIGIDIDNSGAGTGVDVLTAGKAAVLKSTATEQVVLDVAHSVAVSSTTVAPVRVQTSGASAPLLQFGAVDYGVVSTASAGATLAYGVRVKVGDTYGWLPIYIDIDVA